MDHGRLDPDRNLWHHLAVEMRKHRQTAKMSEDDVARYLECDRSTVSRYENGRRRIGFPVATKLDNLWNTGGSLARVARFADERGDDGEWFADLTTHESDASHHRMWSALWVPGLLQTSDYARSAMLTGLELLANPSGIDEALAGRLDRQRAVFEQSPLPKVSVILNWTVLAQPVGGAAVMRAQLARLLELAEHPNVMVRVIEREVGENLGLDGSFRLFSIDGAEVCFVEAPDRGRLVMEPTRVHRFALRYDHLSNLASSRGASRELVVKAMEGY